MAAPGNALNMYMWEALNVSYLTILLFFGKENQEGIEERCFDLAKLALLLVLICIQRKVDGFLHKQSETNGLQRAHPLAKVCLYVSRSICIYPCLCHEDERVFIVLLCLAQALILSQTYILASTFSHFLLSISTTTTISLGLCALRNRWAVELSLCLACSGGLAGVLRRWGNDKEDKDNSGGLFRTVAVQTGNEGQDNLEDCGCVYRQLFLSVAQPIVVVDLNIDVEQAQPHLLNPEAKALMDGLAFDFFEHTQLDQAGCGLHDLIRSMRRRFEDQVIKRDKARIQGSSPRPIAVFDFTAVSFNTSPDSRKMGILLLEVPRAEDHAQHILARFKTSLICSLTHELCTPMNSLLPLLRLLPGYISEETHEDLKDVALGNAELLYSKIRDLIDYSKIELHDFYLNNTEFYIEDLFQEIKQLIHFEVVHQHNSYENKVCLVGSRPLLILADRLRLKQVLVKLVTNANKYTSRGQIKLMAVENPDNLDVDFIVQDTGRGITTERLSFLFCSVLEKAEYLEEHKQGSTQLPGFGLTIAKSICEHMDSDLKVVSKENEGTTFSFTLPACRLFGTLSRTSVDRRSSTAGSPRVNNHNLFTEETPRARAKRRTQLTFKEWPRPVPPQQQERSREAETTPQFGCLGPINPQRLLQQQLAKMRKRAADTNSKPTAPQGVPSMRTLKLPIDSALQSDVAPDLPPELEARSFLELHGDMEDDTSEDKAINPGKAPIAKTCVQLPSQSEGMDSVVLIVDDTSSNRLVLREMLQRLGVGVLEAADGEQAVEQVRMALKLEARISIKIILMDLNMPVMDGIQATKEIRMLEKLYKRQPAIPIIAVTANNSQMDKDASFEAGMQDFITKPVLQSQLKDLIMEYVGPGKRPTFG